MRQLLFNLTLRRFYGVASLVLLGRVAAFASDTTTGSTTGTTTDGVIDFNDQFTMVRDQMFHWVDGNKTGLFTILSMVLGISFVFWVLSMVRRGGG